MHGVSSSEDTEGHIYYSRSADSQHIMCPLACSVWTQPWDGVNAEEMQEYGVWVDGEETKPLVNTKDSINGTFMGGASVLQRNAGRRMIASSYLRGYEQGRSMPVAESCYGQHGCVAGCHMTHLLVTASSRSIQEPEQV